MMTVASAILTRIAGAARAISRDTRASASPAAPSQEVVLTHSDVPISPEPSARRALPAALQEDPLFKDLCAADYLALGYRHGTVEPDFEALEHGRTRLIARATAVYDHMAQAREAWLDHAALRLLDVGQAGTPLGADRLRETTQAWRRDVDTLQKQRQLARTGDGWIEPLLADYQAGFRRALRESLDAQFWAR